MPSIQDPWWRLPGPDNFINGIIRDLEDGRSVIVRMPEHAPDAVLEINLRLYHHHFLNDRRFLDLDDPDSIYTHSPGRFLLNDLGRDSGQEPTATVLAEISELSGRCYVISGMKPLQVSLWEQFALAYASAVRGHRLEERAVFCLFTYGIETEPEPDITFSIHKYAGVVGATEMMLYLAPKAYARYGPGLKRQLYLQLASTLAGFDPELGDYLCDYDIDALLKPVDILGEFGRTRGWHTEPFAIPGWNNGIDDTVEACPCRHAAFLANQGDSDRIEASIWESEIAVIFPYLERARASIVSDLNGRLILPLKVNETDSISEPCELELGHLAYMATIHKIRDIKDDLRNFLYDLRDARHSLAHLYPVPTDLLGRLLEASLLGVPRFKWKKSKR